MPKMKSHRGLAKRVKKTGTGELKEGALYKPPLSWKNTETETSFEKSVIGTQNRLQAY